MEFWIFGLDVVGCRFVGWLGSNIVGCYWRLGSSLVIVWFIDLVYWYVIEGVVIFFEELLGSYIVVVRLGRFVKGWGSLYVFLGLWL